MVVLLIREGRADIPARRRPRCKRRDSSGWRWRGFSWPDGGPSSAQQSHRHSRFLPPHHRHSHRRPSIHRRHPPCRKRPRPPFHQDQAPFQDHPWWSRLRVEAHPARSLALIGSRLPRRGQPTSRKRTKADLARDLTAGTGAAQVTPPIVRVFGQHLHTQLRTAECAVPSNSQTDVTPSGVVVRIDAGAS